MPEAQAAFFGWCTENLKRHSDTFISGPGLNSVYFWTEQSPPTASNAGTWMTLFDDERQRQIVRSLANYPKACVLYNRERAKFWTERLVPPKDVFSSPLNHYIKENFEEVGRVQDFQFMVRKDRAKPELTFFASWKQWVGGKEESETTGGSDEASESQGGRNAVLLRLPTRPDWQVHRIVIAGGQTFVADTHPAAGTAKVAVFDEEGQRIELPFLPVSDSAGLRRVWLVPVEPLDRSAPRELFVRLLGPRDEWIASIPFED